MFLINMSKKSKSHIISKLSGEEEPEYDQLAKDLIKKDLIQFMDLIFI